MNKEMYECYDPQVLDAAQLVRIESVHRGFLYQHLYTVGCLLLAQTANVDAVLVDHDEDIELLTKHGLIYVQVKTRSKSIIPSDISGALFRFEQLRKEHIEGKRKGKAEFVIVTNQAPSIQLQKIIDKKELPVDIVFLSPQSSSEGYPALPPAWKSITEAVTWCIEHAQKLNYSLLSPETLVWKLAGLTQLTATGSDVNVNHIFHTRDLPDLFEQLIVQLQNFPKPPALYRPHRQEPSLTSDERIRIICGLSGSGKTAWAAHAAQYFTQLCAYYNVGDLPGPALASTLVRELAAKLANSDRVNQQKFLLTGASGYENLRAVDTYLQNQGTTLLLVLDNSHRVPVEDLLDVLDATTRIHFVLLCQPHDNVRKLEAVTGVQREQLLGWDIDTVAAAVDNYGGFASAQGYEQLRSYTGGLPLYVESAIKIAIAEYKGNVDKLCAELQQHRHSIETAQEVILAQVYQGFKPLVQNALALFSLSDIGLSFEEVAELLKDSLNISLTAASALIREMRATGTIEIYENQTLKVHDAIRALGLIHLESMDQYIVNKALLSLKKLLVVSLNKTQDISKFSLLTQIYIKLNDVMTLFELSGEEMFYEMGITVNIMASLERAVFSDKLKPEHKFWVLDSLVFFEIREGRFDRVPQWFDMIDTLFANHQLSYREEISYTSKRMLFAAENDDICEVQRLVKQASSKISDAEDQRIFDYNHAIALQKLKKYKETELLCRNIINEYCKLLGISWMDVKDTNPNELWAIINKPKNIHEHLKHLADALELYAISQESQKKMTLFVRILSMQFYNLAGAPESMVRVGQDLADEFAAVKNFVGAIKVMEYVLTIVSEFKLVHRLVQVRSQYAVILALSGRHEEAKAEMLRLNPYFKGLPDKQLEELENQSNLISQLALQRDKS